MSLLKEFNVGGLVLRNRTARSATWEGMADAEGTVTPALVELYRAYSRGHVGLVITSHSYVLPNGHAHKGQIGLYSDRVAESHRPLVQAAHEHGSKACAQLAHAGRMAVPEDRVGASGHAACKPDGTQLPACREATAADMDAIVEGFVAAARRAKAVGYDMVQLHCAHGYLLSQFLSPAWNKRTDDYGGPLENRARLALRVARAIREAVGNGFPVAVKLNTEDFVEGGLTVEESSQVAVWLQQEAGVCLFEASGGTFISKYGAGRRLKDCTEGYHRAGAAAWKRALQGRDAVVCLVGGVRDAVEAQKAIDEGTCDMISMSRPLIREPGLVAKWEGDVTHRATCISCSKCFEPVMAGTGMMCPIQEAIDSKAKAAH